MANTIVAILLLVLVIIGIIYLIKLLLKGAHFIVNKIKNLKNKKRKE